MINNKSFLVLITILSCIYFCHSIEYIGGQGYTIIPDFKVNPSYDYYELDSIKGEFKRYSYPLIPGNLIAGYTKTPYSKSLYDFKFLIGNYDELFIGFGGYNLGGSRKNDNYYVFGSFFLESVEGLFTGAFFYRDSDIEWGWCYEQTVSEGVSYFYEKRGMFVNRGYKIGLGNNIFYKNVEVDVKNKYNLTESKYIGIIYSMNY